MITKRTVDIRTGKEGPKWDPYAYQELTIKTNKNKVKVHLGLAEYIEINGKRISTNGIFELYEAFEEEVHASYNSVIRSYWKSQNKCPNCGKTRFTTVDGYPGEILYICQKCNKIVRSYTDMSAII